MAKTQGHGNPAWSREETLLALELYLELKGDIPSGKDPRVIALSERLRGLPIHEGAYKRDSFRNPDGVVFKLQNLGNLDTGKGLKNVSKIDRAVWAEFGNDQKKVRKVITGINSDTRILQSLSGKDEVGDNMVFHEGKLATKTHLVRERNPGVRKALLAYRKKKGSLICDICGATHVSDNIDIQDAQFEGHHTIPLAMRERVQETKIADMSLLCATCHRLLHRAIAHEKRWIGIEEAKQLLSFN